MEAEDFEWRLHSSSGGVYENIALDELFMEKAAEDGKAFLRLFGFEEIGLALGRNQSVEDVSLEQVAEEGLELTRRESGPAAINCDPGSAYFSFIVPLDESDSKTVDLQSVFGPVVAETVRDMGVPGDAVEVAEQIGVDLETPCGEYRAGAGTAQRLGRNAGYYHGVLFLNLDTEYYSRFIDFKESGREDEEYLVDRLVSLLDYEGFERDLSAVEAREEFGERLQEQVGEMESYELDGGDRSRLEELAREKYENDDWVLYADRGGELDSGRGFCPIPPGME
ncbi:MAG: biotin/lipoate A/B protein ligase family protein [Candidatus Nanohaloarchaea archaeon]